MSAIWQPIATAPDLERIVVCGWQAPVGRTAGYWWWHEDCVADGVPLDHPDALFWTQITLPDFPAPPARVEIPTIVDGPRGPEFIRQPDYARIGIDDPEGRN